MIVKHKTLTTLAAGFFLLAAGQVANAAPVSLSQLQNQTVDGENFNFTFNGLAASDGTGGTLVVRARGDYNGAFNETLTWNAEGSAGATAGGFIGGVGGFGGGYDFVNPSPTTANVVEWQRTTSLSGALLTALLADSVLDVFVDLTDFVEAFDPPNFVEITLNYNDSSVVPLPAALPLLAGGLGVFGLLGWRRKRTASTSVA